MYTGLTGKFIFTLHFLCTERKRYFVLHVYPLNGTARWNLIGGCWYVTGFFAICDCSSYPATYESLSAAEAQKEFALSLLASGIPELQKHASKLLTKSDIDCINRQV